MCVIKLPQRISNILGEVETRFRTTYFLILFRSLFEWITWVRINKKQISKSSSSVLLKGQSHEILHFILRNSFLTLYFVLSRLWFLTFQSCLLCLKGNLVLFTSMKIHPNEPNCTENRCCSTAQILSVKRFRKLLMQSQKSVNDFVKTTKVFNFSQISS